MLRGNLISDYIIKLVARYNIRIDRDTRTLIIENPTEKEAYAIAKGYRTAYSNRVR